MTQVKEPLQKFNNHDQNQKTPEIRASMQQALKYVGHSLPLHDVVAKATGKIRYTGDMDFAGMLYAKILFSPLAHGRIAKIDASEALAVPGVVAVFTHQNTPETLYNSQVWFAGQEARADERLFQDTVRFVGDRVAAVVAVDKKTAAKALKLIKVEYEELPAVFDPEQDSLNAVEIHPGGSPFFGISERKASKVHKRNYGFRLRPRLVASRVFFEKEFGCGNPSEVFNTELTRPKSPASIGGGSQRAVKSSMDSTNIQWGLNPPLNEVSFNKAPLIIEDRVETPKIHHAAMEPHVCIAVPDYSGKLTVYSPCQILYSVRLVVAEVLGLPYNKVRILKTPMGGSFGGKQEVTLEPLAAFFAQATGKPVKIEFNRKESIVSTRTRTRTIGYVRTAVDRDGKILAREVNTLVDTGAYTSNGSVVSMAMGKKIFRLYRIEHQVYRVRAVHTNTPVAGAARGYGSPQIHAITEINLDHAAKELGLDPVEFRLRNLVHPYDQDLSGGPSLGNARIIDCVEEGAKLFRWHERRVQAEADRSQSRNERFHRGVGMACATHSNGYFGAFQDFTTMTLRMLEDGSMSLNSGIHELGCGTVTTMKQIIAEVMDIHPDRIEAPEGDTETSPYDVGSQASRVTHICGAGALKVAHKVKEIFQREASKVLGCGPEEVVLQAETVWAEAKPEEKLTYGEMARLIQRKNRTEIIATETYQAADNPGSYGANFVEVEVDTFTGLVRVIDLLAVHDVGKAINPGFVKGQIYGGVQMGIGLALSEDLQIDPQSGKAKGDSFARYHIVNAPDMPPVEVLLIEKGGDLGPFGAKSIGEIATCPTAPAVVNAVNHALGTNLTTLPLTPERILAAISL